MNLKLITPVFFVLFTITVFSQNVFQKVSGIGNHGTAYSFCISADSNIVIATTGSLVKTNTSGDIIWAKRYLFPAMYKKSRVISQQNGGFMVVYEMTADGFGSGDILIFNTDSAGLIEWIRYYGNDYVDIPYDITELPDGDFVITGQTNSIGQTDKDILLMRINKSGDQYWQRTYGVPSADDLAEKVVNSAFGGFLLCGSIGGGFSLLRTDDNGVMLWYKIYESGTLHDVIENPANGDIYACGVIQPSTRGQSNFFVMHADSSGDVIWAKVFGNNHEEIAYSLSCSDDFSKIYIAGSCQADTTSGSDAFAACLDAGDGTILWSKFYGSVQQDVFYDNDLMQGSLINVGMSLCCDTSYQNFYMVKTDLDGVSGCNETDYIPLVDSTLELSPYPISVRSDSGDLWVSSTCYPPSAVSYQQLTLCTTESTEDIAEPRINLFPNPADNCVIVDYKLQAGDKIELFNATGSSTDCHYNIIGGKMELMTGNLPRGIYFIRVTAERRTFAAKLILD